MEVIVCVTCAALAWVASWSLLGRGQAGAGSPLARARAVLHVGRRMIVTLASSRLVEALGSWQSVSSVADEVARLADKVGERVTEREAVAVVLASWGLAALGGLLVSHALVGAVAALFLAVLAVVLHAAGMERRRARQLAEEMPGVFRTLATAMGAGHTLVQAIDYVGLHEQGPAGEEFVRTSLRLRCGMPTSEALGRLSDELDAPGVELMATALDISQRTGSPLRDLFQRSALLVEQQGEFERTLAVKTAQVRLSVRIVCALPACMVCLLSLVSPDFQEGLGTGAGMACLAVAALMDGAALVLIRKIMGGVL